MGARNHRATARAAAALLASASLACTSSEKPGTADFGGTWEGVLAVRSGGTGGASPTGAVLSQDGDVVTGTLAGAALLGKAEGSTLTFTLDFGGSCGILVAGSASVTPLPDRDRLQLTFQGASSCEGSITGGGVLERMRCGAPATACSTLGSAAYAPPYCADLSSDLANCGACGVACGELQRCSSGACTLPACTGPVPLGAPQTFFAADVLWSLVLADADRDGAPDAIASGAMISADVQGAVVVLLNDGSGALSTRRLTLLSSLFAGTPPGAPSAIAAGDLDGDGLLDLAAYVGAPWSAGPPWTGGLLTLLGNGDGTFRAGERLPVAPDEIAEYLGPRVVAVADLNGDGVGDVAARLGDAPAVQVRLGVRGGALGPATEYPVAQAVDVVAAADVDGDGAVDLVVLSESVAGGVATRQVSVLPANGDGTFRTAIASAGVADPQDVVVADLDEDGIADLAAIGGRFTGWARADVSVLLGNGDGTFGPPRTLHEKGLSSMFSVAVADLDGDGHRDLVAGDDERGLALFLGRGDGSFTPFENPVPGGSGLVAAMDVDGDGRTDVVVSDEGGWDEAAVYRACAP